MTFTYWYRDCTAEYERRRRSRVRAKSRIRIRVILAAKIVLVNLVVEDRGKDGEKGGVRVAQTAQNQHKSHSSPSLD